MIHYDIPFNPNRLEQRIGRVDRYGQDHQVEVMHFVGAGWEHAAAGSYEGDLEYLSRVAQKIAVERQDLGSVNPVLAHAVEARMLGRPVLVDPLTVTAKPSASGAARRARPARPGAPGCASSSTTASPAARRPGERPPGGGHRARPGRPAAAGRRDRSRPGRADRAARAARRLGTHGCRPAPIRWTGTCGR